jgi:hypothetical protein
MKPHFTLITAICLPLLLLIGACKPDKPDQQKYLGTYPLGDIKDYLYFKPGSMWVYECDSTGELDTQVMVSCDTPWVIKSFIKYQLLTCKIQSINEGSTYSSPLPFGDLYYKKEYSYFWSITRYRSNPKDLGSGRDCIFFKPYDTNSSGGLGDSPCKYKGLLTNYTVLGKNYDTVRVFQVQATSGWPKPQSPCIESMDYIAGMRYYYAKKVGIVKITTYAWDYINKLPFTHSWNLKSYDLK